MTVLTTLSHLLQSLLAALSFDLPRLQDGLASPELPGSTESGVWFDGIWEVDFVLVSVFVGAVGILLVVHLARRLTVRKDLS